MKNTLQIINREIEQNPEGFINRAEKSYLDGIRAAAQRIADDDRIKIVALAGPSGAGKTTTAHILRDCLNALDENTAVASLDDFYLPYDELPFLPDGSRDMESVHALDLGVMKKCFKEIIESGKTQLPRYDFKNKNRDQATTEINIGSRGIIIAEGLHALNPEITELVSRENIFKIYISVNESIFDTNGKQLLSSRQIRLMRRSLRDEVFRGADVNRTLSMWESVVAGEEKYLYCFKNTADVMLVTLHAYEPCLYKERIVKMCDGLNKDTPCRDYFIKTAAAVERFVTLDEKYVPSDSVIREFIGNGKYN